MIRKIWMLLAAALVLIGAAGCSQGDNEFSDMGKEEDKITEENQEEAYVKFPEFEATTLEGDSIDASIFTEAEVTMVNIWGTFCGPCINEMPDLEELYGELPEGCALVGVLTDVYGYENLDAAVEIVTKTGITYDNIIPDELLYQFLAENITGVPTSLYVDSEGNILGGVVGAKSKDEYKAILEELVKE